MIKKDKIDCCFLVPNNAKKSYQKLSETYSAIEPPTWALLLAQSMRTFGFKVSIMKKIINKNNSIAYSSTIIRNSIIKIFSRRIKYSFSGIY